MSTLGEEGTLSAYKEKTIREKFFLKGQGFGNTFKSHVTLSACECTAISTCTAQGLLISAMPYCTCEGLKGSSGRRRGPKKSNS